MCVFVCVVCVCVCVFNGFKKLIPVNKSEVFDKNKKLYLLIIIYKHFF